MRSSKAPPNQKNRGKFYPTPPNLASQHPNRNARRGYLGTSVPQRGANSISCVLYFNCFSIKSSTSLLLQGGWTIIGQTYPPHS